MFFIILIIIINCGRVCVCVCVYVLRVYYCCRSRSDSVSKDSKYSIDEEVLSDEDGMKPSPFRRSSRKSMFLDDGSVWGRWQDKLADLDFDVSNNTLHVTIHVVTFDREHSYPIIR